MLRVPVESMGLFWQKTWIEFSTASFEFFHNNSLNLMTKIAVKIVSIQGSIHLECMCANHYTTKPSVLAIIFKWSLVYAAWTVWSFQVSSFVEFAEFSELIDSASWSERIRLGSPLSAVAPTVKVKRVEKIVYGANALTGNNPLLHGDIYDHKGSCLKSPSSNNNHRQLNSAIT